MEQIRYHLLFRWFIGLAIDDEVWDHSVFPKNLDRLLEHAVVERFFTEAMCLADQQGTLLGGWHADPGMGQSQELRVGAALRGAVRSIWHSGRLGWRNQRARFKRRSQASLFKAADVGETDLERTLDFDSQAGEPFASPLYR